MRTRSNMIGDLDMQRAAAAAMIILWMLIGFLLGLAVGSETTQEEWFLKRWETLIAGILAVLAAGWTVNTMLVADRSQQRRHDQLIKMNLRRDVLAVHRAADPYASMMRSLASMFQVGTNELRGARQAQGLNKELIREIQERFNSLHNMLQEEAIQAARDLFPPDLSFDFRQAKRTASGGAAAGALLLESFSNPLGRSVESALSAVEKWLDIGADQLVRMADRLEALASSYREGDRRDS